MDKNIEDRISLLEASQLAFNEKIEKYDMLPDQARKLWEISNNLEDTSSKLREMLSKLSASYMEKITGIIQEFDRKVSDLIKENEHASKELKLVRQKVSGIISPGKVLNKVEDKQIGDSV